MWSLAEFLFDEAVPDTQVYLDRGDGLDLMSRDEALTFVRGHDAHLVFKNFIGDEGDEDVAAVCAVVAKVSLPLRWERLPEEPRVHDERLWFVGPCGHRDLLVGNGHTFTGRISAWCPHEEYGFSVSLAEIEEMSTEARYFITGYLAGSEPGPPIDGAGMSTDADWTAWRAATARFRRTGYWWDSRTTCHACGCVLLPDSAAQYCHEHLEATGEPDTSAGQ